MSMINDIRRDREVGTPGPWKAPYDDCGCYVDTPGDNSVIFIGKSSAPFAATFVHSSFGKDHILYANARRIARLPDLEAALLAADELANNLEMWLNAVEEVPVPAEIWDAFDAYRKAAEAAE